MSEEWLQRWQESRTGWHQPDGNAGLKRHWRATGKRVLVPLCGKTPDLLWLERQGNDVIGVELSDIAVEEFFDENRIRFERVPGALTRYTAIERRVTIFCGDYFELSAGPFDACYDRGALVAVAPGNRRRYVGHTRSLLSANAAKLVISVEYDQAIANGPPFSIAADEMLDYWPDLRRVSACEDIANGPPKFREAGLASMLEVVWRSP